MENTEHIYTEQENGGIQSSWITLILKFVLENGGEYRAHREQENCIDYI